MADHGRVAIVHDWLTGMRGGERVLEALLRIHPDADLFTMVHVPGRVSPEIEGRRVVTSFLDRLPLAHRAKHLWLPLFPWAIESLDLTGYDLVVSTSSCVAKGALAPPDALHLCVCFSPMRYAYDQGAPYRQAVPALLRPAWDLVMGGMRTWDAASAGRPDRFVAISRTTAARIRRYYRRDSALIFPHVDLDLFPVSAAPRGDYYLVLSALVPYKRVDLAVRAARRLPYKVVVAGDGPELAALKRMAGPEVEFLGRVSDAERLGLVEGCRALLFPGEEDFGIVPLEVNAVGRPVVGFGRGGLTETQVEGRTAVFHHELTPESLADAVLESERVEWQPGVLRANAERFSEAAFREAWLAEVEACRRRRESGAG